jgi:hypothetical protein
MSGNTDESVPHTTSENLIRGGPPVPDTRKAGAGSLANELSVRLWEERRHVESLHSVLEANTRKVQHRDAAQGALRVREIYIELQIAGLARYVAAQSLAEEWNVEGGSTLQQLICIAHVEPWAYIFWLHLEALREAVGRIEKFWAETCFSSDRGAHSSPAAETPIRMDIGSEKPRELRKSSDAVGRHNGSGPASSAPIPRALRDFISEHGHMAADEPSQGLVTGR